MKAYSARMDRPDFVLDEQLCFALHTASRAMTGCYRPLLDDIGLTYSQYAVMLVLWELDTVPLGLLCSRLQLDTGTLSPLLKRLEAEGLITRRRRLEDERTMQLTLTRTGRALRERAAAIQARVQDGTGLTPGELAVMRDGLHALAARLRAADLRPDVAS
jgi:MarR family transcriptional regulator, organic hydroperoxide resistance regulator